MTERLRYTLAASALAALCAVGPVRAATVYRCPGPPVLYTDALTSAEAKRQKCSTIRNAPITVITSPVRLTPLPEVNLNELSEQTRGQMVDEKTATPMPRSRAPARAPAKSAGSGAGSTSASSSGAKSASAGFYADGDANVSSGTQQSRDRDARMILETELKRETAALDDLRAQYRNGQLEPLPGENSASPKYQQRVAEMKTRINRHENDVRAITKELDRLKR